MKKERTAKQTEFRNSLKEGLARFLPSFLFVAVIGVIALVIALMPSAEEVDERVEVYRYEGSDAEIVVENSELKFVMDPTTTQFVVTNKSSGQQWYSNPQDADDDPIALPNVVSSLKSTLLLTYSTQIGVDTTLDNYQYSVMSQVYNIESGEDYVKVKYSIGKIQKEFIIPQVIEASRMEELTAGMEKKTTQLIRDYYIKYDINNLKPTDNKDELLESYPALETQVLYVLRDNATDNIKARFETPFQEAGYTEEEYRQEIEEYGIESANDRPVFNVSMIYRLKGEELIVEVPMDEIEYKSSYPILNLTILPYFGAGAASEEGYLLIPEGGGSLIDFNNGKVNQNTYYANMYGWDMAVGRRYLIHETQVYYGVFGIAKGDSSFICLLEDGAAYAAVNADISGKLHNYNYVNVTYSMLNRERAEVGSRTTTDVYMYQQELPQERLVQRYRFIDSGSYVDMANSYHNYLSAKFGDAFAKNEDTSVPVSVEIVGAVDKVKQVLGVPVSRPLPVTSYAEAQAIVEELNSSGVKNMSVKLSGWMNGGINQKVLKKAKLVSGLGGKKNLKSLTGYAADNNIDLYLDGVTNYANKPSIWNGFLAFRDAASFANKKRAQLKPFDPVDYAPQNSRDSYYLVKPSLVLSSMDTLSKAADTYGAAGVSFADVGFQLSSDYKQKAFVSRQAAEEQQVEKLGEIKAGGQKIMVNMGNDYALGMADQIVNMDLAGAGYTLIDRQVPFYQIALHGYINYAGEPLNLTENYEEELLKSAEYGAGLYVTFMDAPITELQNTYYTQYYGANYDSWKDRFLEIYQNYEASLGHVFNQRIVDHQGLGEQTAMTVYEDGTKVYVNYGYTDYTTGDGVKVPARNYVVR